MKLKNVNFSFLILFGLVFLSLAFFAVAENKSTTANIFLDSDQDGLTDEEERSYGTDPKNPDTDGDGYSDGTEVASGYDPLVMAPDDRMPEEKADKSEEDLPESQEGNLTQKMAQKISTMMTEADSDEQGIIVSDIETMIDSALGEQNVENELPEISVSDIKIKSQNYESLSEEDAREKKKEDFSEYLAAVTYIMASNSPKPVTSANGVSSIMNQMLQQAIDSLSSQDSSALSEFSMSGEKIGEQLMEVTVPEELVDTHIKALQYVSYSKELRKLIDANAEDPMLDLVNYSKLSAFVQNLAGFYEDIQGKLEEYGIEDSDVQERMSDYGLEISQ